MKLKVLACALLLFLAAADLASAAPSVSIVATRFSAGSARGQLSARVAVKVENRGRRALSVSASDFALSAQGDIFRAPPPDRRVSRIAPGRSRVIRLSFTIPRVARDHVSLFYRGSGSVPLVRRASVRPRAFASANTFNTFWATAGVGEPWGTAIDGAGNVWFAEPGCDFAPSCSSSAQPGQIGVVRASSHAVVFYTLPNLPGNQPIFLAFDGSGNIWFTTPNNSMIGEFNPATGQFTGQWPVAPRSGPWDLTFVGNTIWYTEHFVSAVGSFDTSTHAYRDFQTPSANSNPYGIAANGPLLWFAENNSGVDRIASLDTRTNAIAEYPIVQPLSGTPHDVAIDGAGHPWWTEGWSSSIATLNPGAATPGQCGTAAGTCNGIQRFKAPPPATCATSGSHTSGIAFQASAGLVWFDNSLTAQVGSFDPVGSSFAMRSLTSCSAHPHDGLSLDAAGNVWFDEEFANAIGELVAPTQPAPGPTAVTGAANPIGTTSATVSGTVNPNGQGTTYHFDFGTSTSYTAQAPAPPDPSAGAGTVSQPVSASLTGLAPGTTYHFRLVATNVSGTAFGSDQTFTTATTTPPPGPLAADAFNRTVASGWGSADFGGLWTLLDPQASWSVTPGAGSVRVAAFGQARAVLSGVAVQDVDLLAQLVLPLCAGGTNCDSFLVGRYTGGAVPTYYRVGAVQGPRSSVYLRAQRSDGSNLVSDLDTGIPAAAGVALWVRVQFQGTKPTTIRARVWPVGTTEPPGWLLTTSDSTAAEQSAGAVGLRARNEDNLVTRTFQFQSFQASSL